MSDRGTVGFHTLGCKLNYAESSTLSRQLEDKGFRINPPDLVSDIYVLNTCSVTEFADKKCRKEVKRFLRLNPEAKVIVIGCYAQLKPKEIAEIPGVTAVLGAAEKFGLVEFISSLGSDEKSVIQRQIISETNRFHSAYSFGDRTRTFLKVQDGCDYSCSFCTIPQARGKSRSDTVENVLQKITEIEKLGSKELVLTGVNLGDFSNGTEVIEGTKPKKEDLFIDLLRAIDAHCEQIRRIRISSIEPNLLTEEIVRFVSASDRFLPHFHVPLQSGNNKQLAAMRRRYKRELYADRVSMIRSILPDACIGVDVIVGFPGETDEDFLETYRFIEALDVNYLHVFTFSARDNTPAFDMPDQVDMNKRRKRNEMLRGLSEQKRRAFYRDNLTTVREILTEPSTDSASLTGFTDNYIKVRLDNPDLSPNEIVETVLVEDMIEW